MGQTVIVHCDDCRSEDSVYPVTVVRSAPKRDSWEVDLCEKCYLDRFGDLMDEARKPTASLRPQNRAKKTEISQDNL